MPTFSLHLPTLLYAGVAALTASAAAMTLFGRTQRTYRGHWWWTAAQWLLALGLLMQSLREAWPAMVPVANLLMLQWPIVVLAGMRRFYSRQAIVVPPLADWLLLALTYLAWLATWAAQAGPAARIVACAGGALLLHLYAAALLTRVAEFRASAALKTLVSIEVLAAGVLAWRVGHALAQPEAPSATEPMLLAAGLVVVLSSLVMVYLSLLLSHERTETNLHAVQRKLRFLADIDVLTRVPNRRHFHELSQRVLGSAVPGAASVLMFDIDHFKRINDLLGHATGDEALRQVARCVRDSLRARDVAGRLGGDEFAVLLPDTPVNDAMAVAQRIVAGLVDRQVAPTIAPLSLSFGVVQMTADEGVEDALRRADQALYEAKRQGRSCAVVATGDEDRPVFGQSRSLGLGTR